MNIHGEQINIPMMPVRLETCIIVGLGSTSSTTNLLLKNSS